MKYFNPRNQLLLAGTFIVLFISACNNGNKNNAVNPDHITYKIDTTKKDSVTGKIEMSSQRPPIINIVDTVTLRMMVLCVKDSSLSSEGIGKKLNRIYKEDLQKIISKQKLSSTEKRIAWYKSNKSPFFFEAGIPINKKPSGKLPKNMFVKQLSEEQAIIAHFYGPYEQTYVGYAALKEWIQDHDKKIAGLPYEVYVGNAIDSLGNVIDPYKVQTDLIIPYR